MVFIKVSEVPEMRICIVRLSRAVSFFHNGRFISVMRISGHLLKFTDLFQIFKGMYCSVEICTEWFFSLCLDDIQYTND